MQGCWKQQIRAAWWMRRSGQHKHGAPSGAQGARQLLRPRAYLGGERRVALVDLAQAVQHLGQLGGVDRFHSDLDNRGGVELQGPENLSLRPKKQTCEATWKQTIPLNGGQGAAWRQRKGHLFWQNKERWERTKGASPSS